ncbi:cytochrome P450 [Gloeobacter kilaueensis]|uniref:Cytochrome P450 n=1 Tax=Gloeobacter kilaueensis (strain ATCC BAA-2537 / CCAP 1431/1 / ULC 316 / JS1) TaxID=1183438 RepID=U5QJR5_GLOK1|nr:cytochrome P450 [Gloeobacter kilaueensis]AGY59171.1 cytochrome P450 [Gloeobacter kilaueensis JS1]
MQVEQMPGDLGLPGLGRLWQVVATEGFGMLSDYRRYGPVFKSSFLGRHCAVLIGPQANRRVLIEAGDQLSSYEGWGPFTEHVFGQPMMLQDGERHRRTRRLMAPAFHGAAIATYSRTMQQIFKQGFTSWTEQRSVPIHQECRKLALVIGIRLLLGVEAEAQVEQIERWYSALLAGTTALLRLEGPLTAYGRARFAREQLQALLGRIVAERQRRGGLEDSADALGLFLAAVDEQGEPLDRAQVVDELVHLVNGAHFTTATALTWALVELAARPGWRERLRGELERVTGSEPLDVAHLRQLVQMGWFLKEIERFYSPAGAILFRGVRQPFEFGGYVIPAGWLVAVSPFVSHRMAELFADPDHFEPERFAPPREEDRQDPLALVGFGAGPHVCIGREFALMELKIALAILLRDYDWTVAPAEQAVTPRLFPARTRDRYRARFVKRTAPN